MLELNLHPDIYQEVNEAYSWYESRSQGLGDDFFHELDAAFFVIQSMPYTWPVLSGRFRRYLLKRFPYGIIYEVNEDCIFVVAVMHLSRKPGYWLKRIK
ncbi:MAG: type II toxin-antitoxin system RelE/ParE family toxin [Desulfobacterales bacterium]|nr:type II toxin-antitoxin system RelE/ParE family toxin [Desulfobacterales bacterium]